jgi:hypothetical protein
MLKANDRNGEDSQGLHGADFNVFRNASEETSDDNFSTAIAL